MCIQPPGDQPFQEVQLFSSHRPPQTVFEPSQMKRTSGSASSAGWREHDPSVNSLVRNFIHSGNQILKLLRAQARRIIHDNPSAIVGI